MDKRSGLDSEMLFSNLVYVEVAGVLPPVLITRGSWSLWYAKLLLHNIPLFATRWCSRMIDLLLWYGSIAFKGALQSS